MVEDGPLPDFMERKDLLDVIDQRLKEAGYLRVAFESYALPSDNMIKELKKKKVHYAAAGTQTGVELILLVSELQQKVTSEMSTIIKIIMI